MKRLEKTYNSVTGIDLKSGKDIQTIKPSHLKDVDVVFHLAAQAKVPLSVERPIFTHNHNINGTLKLLECAKKAGVKRVVYSASSSAYGEQIGLISYEDLTPNPMSPYGLQKLVGEYYCKLYSDLYGLETVSLRYFNVYGDDMPLDGAYSACIAQFLNNKKNGKPLEIYGGKQSRDFTFVGDVVEANLLAATSKLVGKGEIINIGSGKSYTIDQIAEAVGGKTVKLPQRKGEPMHTQADNEKAKNLLNWKPTVDVIDWIKDNA
jgi:UDP-glucose 4-epimerase